MCISVLLVCLSVERGITVASGSGVTTSFLVESFGHSHMYEC